MKLFLNNINNNTKKISLKNNRNTIGKIKILPSFSKEWKNTVYSYNRNLLKNIPNNNLNINNIIKSYFNLYFKDNKKFFLKNKLGIIRKKHKTPSKVFVSNAEIKHNNHKAKITLYIVNREKLITSNKYHLLNKIFMKKIMKKHYLNFYKKKIINMFNIFKEFKNDYNFFSTMIKKRSFIAYKLKYLNKFISLKHFYLEKLINRLIRKYIKKHHLKIIKKYELKNSLNQYKLNQSKYLPNLSHILFNLIGKKLEYNIINLKSFSHNSDIFTEILGLLIRRKRTIRLLKSMSSILKKVSSLPKHNKIQERTNIREFNQDKILNNYKNYKLIGNLSDHLNLNDLLNNYNELNKNEDQIHNTIFNNINYKKLEGVRIELKGRLTKRYRADRAIYRYRSKGELKNIYSSYKGLSTVLFRGNTKSNTSYSCFNSKRRIGAFAVKGWIAGK